MSNLNALNTIIGKIAEGSATQADIETLRLVLLTHSEQTTLQFGKYNVNIGQGQDVRIGDNIYYPELNDEAIGAIAHHIFQKLQSANSSAEPQRASVDELVQQVRSRLHDDIQSLHGMMPLWGVDRWVPLGELFVDVNILEELSSSRRWELDDLWQDFTTGMQGYSSYRSLDRIGLGKEQKRVSGLELLAKNTNLMVVGKPGSGKTTYLQRVVTECNAGNLQAHQIPVLIKQREFVEDGREVAYSLERYLERCWRLLDAETRLVLARGRALVLLDGLDEVTGEDGKNITKEIKRFARAYPQVQIIVTCRTQSQESRFERFDYVEVADFNEPQVRAFAEHWFKTVMGDESAGLAKAQEFLGLLFLEANKPIRELAITPILLTLTCAVFHQTGKFYSKRSKLYEEGLELLLEQWDKSREIERDEIYRDLSVERKLELLSYLAVKKFEQPQYVLFEQAEIEGYIAEFLKIGQRDSRVVLRAIESQHGLLIERSHKVWSFSHLTFQEYLAAKCLVRSSSWAKLLKYITQGKYREIFLMISELLEQADRFVSLMKTKIDKLVASDNRLQEFLKVVCQTSSRVKTDFNSASIRAFHFVAHGDYSLNFLSNGESNLLKEELSSKLELSDIAKLKLPDFRLVCLSACETGLTDSVVTGEALKVNSYLDNLEHNTLASLWTLREELPTKDVGISNLERWLINDYEHWVKRLRKVMLEFHKLDESWKFSDKQQKLFEEYYDANRLLVDCLNRASMLREQTRKEIEETIFLPIAEIEKRKRKKAK